MDKIMYANYLQCKNGKTFTVGNYKTGDANDDGECRDQVQSSISLRENVPCQKQLQKKLTHHKISQVKFELRLSLLAQCRFNHDLIY